MTSVTSHLEVLTRYQHEFLDTIGRADPATPVPWCGRWRVSNLVVHLARVHHWAAAQARRQREIPLGRGPFELGQLYGDCALELRTTLTELDPDARAWTLLDDGVPRAEQRGTVTFWHRRQTLETLVHLWDLRTAIGEDMEAAPAPGPGSWVDCIDEVATVMHPRQIRLGRVAPPPVRLRLEASDAVGSWELEAAPGTIETVTITGAARELALLVWGRAELNDPRLSVMGEHESAAQALAAGLTP